MRDGHGLLGWATHDLVRLDSLPEGRGLLSRVLTVSPMRRQAIFMALAHRREASAGEAEPSPEAETALAGVLQRERAREIIEHVIGAVPEGLLGALERIDKPFASPSSYVRLYQFFAHTEHRSKAEALQYLGEITEPLLRVLDALDPRWLHVETLRRIDNAVEARDFNRAVAFAQRVSSSATDDAVAGAIARLPPTSSLAGLVQRFVRRADHLPDHPVEATDDIRPLVTPRDLIEAGRRYHNCLPTKVEEVVIGRVAYAEFRRQCIVEFRPLTGAAGWVVWEVHGPRNEPVGAPIAAAAFDACLMQGISRVDQGRSIADWGAYRRFTRQIDWALLQT